MRTEWNNLAWSGKRSATFLSHMHFVRRFSEPPGYTACISNANPNFGQTYEEIHRFHPNLKCIYHDDVIEYHCGRLQGLTRNQALAICAKEGITYKQLRSQQGDVSCPFPNRTNFHLEVRHGKKSTTVSVDSGRKRFYHYGIPMPSFWSYPMEGPFQLCGNGFLRVITR